MVKIAESEVNSVFEEIERIKKNRFRKN